MGDDDSADKPKRVVGVGENPPPNVWHDHVSSILFVANLGFVTTLAVMAMANKTLTLPAFLTGALHTTMAQDMHLASTAAGLAFSGVLVIVAAWLLLLWTSAYAVIIGGQIAMLVCLLGTAGLAFAIGQQDGNIHKVLSFVPPAPVVPSLEEFFVESAAAADAATQQGVGVYYYVMSLICVVLAVLLVIWLFCIRERIAFTAAILSNVSKVLLQLPELLALQLIACVLVLGYAALWAFAAIELNGKLAESGQGAFVFFLVNTGAVFSFFWGQLVIVNISLTTTCGAIGGWYYEPLSSLKGGCLFCRPAVCQPLIRCCTTSLGSIALGSLLIAIMRTIIAVVTYVSDRASEGNPILKIAFCCCTCCLGCLESIMQWLTDYAYVYVALYGTHFIDAGMKVVKLLSSSGVDAIAQQSLVAPVLRLAAFLGLGAGVALGYAAMIITGVRGVSFIGMIVGGGVGYILTQLLLAPVDAAAKTIFVCYAEDPSGLIDKAPELAEKIAENKSLKSGSTEDNVVAP